MSRSIKDALAHCLNRLEAGEVTPEEALRLYPELRSELAPLLDLSAELRAMPKVEAPASLRGHKRPVFRPAPARQTWWSGLFSARGGQAGWSASLARAAAILAVLPVLVGGTVVASANSLPDEPLYPVKLAVENAQLAVATDGRARADLELQFAAKRLREVERAVEQGRTDAVTKGLDLYSQQANAALRAAVTTAAQGRAEVEDSLRQNQAALEKVLAKVENDKARDAIEHAMAVSSQPPGQAEEKNGKALGQAEEKNGKADKSDKAVPDVAAPGRDKATATPSPAPSPTTRTAQPTEAPKGPNENSDKPKGNEERASNSGQPGNPGQTATPGHSGKTDQPGNSGQDKQGNQDSRGQGQTPKQTQPSQNAVEPATPTPTATAPPNAAPTNPPVPAATPVQPSRGNSDSSRGNPAEPNRPDNIPPKKGNN